MHQHTFMTVWQQLKQFRLIFQVFLGIKMCSLNASLGALMVFGGYPIPSTGRLGCSASVCSQMVSIHQLQAISWKAMRLRMMKIVYDVL